MSASNPDPDCVCSHRLSDHQERWRTNEAGEVVEIRDLCDHCFCTMFRYKEKAQ